MYNHMCAHVCVCVGGGAGTHLLPHGALVGVPGTLVMVGEGDDAGADPQNHAAHRKIKQNQKDPL